MNIRKTIIILVIIFSMIPVIVITSISVMNLSNNSEKLLKQNLKTAAKLQSQNIDNFFKQRKIDINVLSTLPQIKQFLVDANNNTDKKNYSQSLELVNDILSVRVNEQPFLNKITLVNKNNYIVSSSKLDYIGERFDIEQKYIDKLLKNEQIVTSIKNNNLNYDEIYSIIISPILVNNEFEGYICFYIDIEFFKILIDEMGFFETGCITIIDNENNIVATSNSHSDSGENIYNLSIDTDLAEKLNEIDKNEKSGYINYDVYNIKKAGYYSYISDTDWIVLSVVETREFIMPIQQTLSLVPSFIIFIILFIGVIYFLLSKILSSPLNQLINNINKIYSGDYSVRLNSNIKNEFGEIGKAFNQLMDKIVSDNKELLINEERYRIVTEQSDSIIFEYNIQNNDIFYSSNFEKKFGFIPSPSFNIEDILNSNKVCNNDKENFKLIYNKILKGTPKIEFEIRVINSKNEYVWCSITITTIFDNNRLPLKVIGKITDIDNIKREQEKLISKSQRDSLTYLYNKKTSETFIKDCLKDSNFNQTHALFVIDIDNFKSINDNLGHLFGDHVLKEISQRILSSSDSNDIVGRIGGDEFIVFVKDIGSMENTIKKAKNLSKIFRQSCKTKTKTYEVSGSIGISLYPKCGDDFISLFEKADKALYTAKHKGKNCFEIFDESIKDTNYVIKMGSGQKVSSNIYEDFTEYIFETLYKSNDINSAIPLILKMLGKYFDVSRVYIFELSDDGLYYNNTFEWCNDNIEPQIKNLQKIPLDFINIYTKIFNDENILYCCDISEFTGEVYQILKQQNIISTLQYLINDNTSFSGIVGFDECNENRLWTKEEIDIIVFISKILSVFLMKYRIQSKLEKII